MYHYRKKHLTYKDHNRSDESVDCPFPICNPSNTQEIIQQNSTMLVIENRVPYDVFEARSVERHLMVIPKRHVELFVDFSDEELLDMMHLIAEYEKEGYNTYARGKGATSRSVIHQHTHLVKTSDDKARTFFYNESPYILVRF